MLDKNSFRTIRPYGGSQQGGFEELICQLAHLAAPPEAQTFVRKEGAGGDAGVECYWVMNDGSEYAWQAKYFVDEINPARWAQINESVETALEKHPKIRRYYVCLPADRTDTRATGPRGKRTVSILDEWNNFVTKWKALASSRSMDIDFVYWGAHEILLPLQSDDARYSGRAFYWFNEVALTNEKLIRCIAKQEKTLGERYTPEFHVDLPIARTLDGLVNGDQFWQEMNQTVSKWSNELAAFFRIKAPSDLIERFDETKSRLEDCSRNLTSVMLTRDRNRLYALRKESDIAYAALEDFAKTCRASEEATKRPNHYSRSFQDEVSDFIHRKHSELSSFLDSDFVKANIAKALLVVGDAGTGKSHLLCDFAKKYTQKNGPAVLLLGQHYRGGNPLEELIDQLDLNSHSYETVLGAIDAAGEAARVNAIVLVDAINEGSHRDEWSERFVGFLDEMKRFPHVSTIVSCRSRFDDRLVPKSLGETELLRVSHEGFRGYEHKAASIYLSRQGISKPTTPITAPEFSNPMFLKTCAAALKQKGETTWPKGYHGASRLFEIYLSSLEMVVSRKRHTEPNDRLGQKALEAVAKAMFPDHLFGLPWERASKIVNEIDTCVKPTESLLQTLLNEGALAEDIQNGEISEGNHKGTPIVRFAYERFSDQFVAQMLLRNIKEPEDIFKDDHPLGKAISENKILKLHGILQSLSIIVPEKFGVEFWQLLPVKMKSLPQAADNFFFASLPFRAPSSFSDQTTELFNSLRSFGGGFYNRKFDIMIQFATEPSHPWNAERLHERLRNQTMPERDSWWSIFVAKNDFQEEDGEPETPIRSVIDWATSADLTSVEEGRIYLTLIALIWFTTTTNRKTRDQATKAAVRLLAKCHWLSARLLKKFLDVDDLYLQERLYAVVYGGLCNASNDDSLKIVSALVFEIQFKGDKPTSHLLLRDYARGIVELAYSRSCMDEAVLIEKCRPPYQSEWPLENPIDSRCNNHGTKIEYSIFSDDFGTYTINVVEKWSPTPLSEPAPESQAQVLDSLVAKLSDASKDLYYKAFATTKLYEEQRWRISIKDFQQFLLDDEETQSIDDLLKLIAPLDDINQKPSEAPAMSMGIESHCPSKEDADSDWKQFTESLDDATREQFDCAQSFWRNGEILASFDRDWAKNWVCKHSFDLGWNKELFGAFEESLKWSGRDRPGIERIGKKYQMIALYKFLAHLADNVHYKDDAGYADTPKPSRYRGPWQLWQRDIDPTHWMRKTSDSEWGEWGENIWWRPIEYKFQRASDDSKRHWCQDPTNLPAFNGYVRIPDESKKYWYSLRGFSKWREKEITGDNSTLTREIWFRINAIVTSKDLLSCLQKELKEVSFISPDFVSSTSTGHQIFLREFPWHPSVTIRDNFGANDAWQIKTPHAVPYAQYEWEKGSGDESAEMNLNLYLPSPFFSKALNLDFDRKNFNRWTNTSGQTEFFDPSLEFDGPSFALFDCMAIDSMLSKNNSVLVWLIGGEKMLMNRKKNRLDARMVYNTMLWTSGDGNIHSIVRHNME
ncbi:hypothetical protein VN12_24370 [Pirellula sp. SH-Sr6A]|nr:hypothetical protein VN12_24370 [Pirellula sp. SH-Sr6A]